MDAVLRVALIYGFLLLVFRLAGRRSLSEATTFDLLMLLIISETTQQAMVDDDHSVTQACILILTLVGLDLGLSLLKDRSKRLEKLLDDVPGAARERRADVSRPDARRAHRPGRSAGSGAPRGAGESGPGEVRRGRARWAHLDHSARPGAASYTGMIPRWAAH
jgi:hypothetical protein